MNAVSCYELVGRIRNLQVSMLRIRLRNICLAEHTWNKVLKQVTFQISSGHLGLFLYFESFQRYHP